MYLNKVTTLIIAVAISASFHVSHAAFLCPDTKEVETAIDALAKDGNANFEGQTLSLVFAATTNQDYNNTLIKSKDELQQFLKTSRAMAKSASMKGTVYASRLDNPPHYCPYKVSIGTNHVTIALSDKENAAPLQCPLLNTTNIEQLKREGFIIAGGPKYTISPVGVADNPKIITNKEGIIKLENTFAPTKVTLKIIPMKNAKKDGRCLYQVSAMMDQTQATTGILALVPAS
ncbi:MAG: hypothetical protein FJX71_02920 [Alphaproteobacteria bacterium]|nr:hypothetical protein [Alphaproteobacteria bacterium]